ncbi:MAG: hypothetical protein FJ104_01285 [Deltaproteobacteria bacterium]|nr:hypothetical protein [Deltaproteobacteria bacterium]
MSRRTSPKLALSALGAAAALSLSHQAAASNPIEFPDNGTGAFSRGGAWLALGNEPLAAHYAPAALATQASAFSLDQNLSYNKVCYGRRGPGNTVIGPNDVVRVTPGDPNSLPTLVYLPTCVNRKAFPTTVPALAFSWRASRRLGIGVAVVPPATYGVPDTGWRLTSQGLNNRTGEKQMMPSPYRYMTVNQLNTIVFPTIGFGYEVFDDVRIGAAFISGMAALNTESVAISKYDSAEVDAAGDHMVDDTYANIRLKDLFIPGVIVSADISVTPYLDVAVWGRYVSAVETSEAEARFTTQIFGPDGKVKPNCNGVLNPDGSRDVSTCTSATENLYVGKTNALTHFKFPIPPEVRLGLRYHRPRPGQAPRAPDGKPVRDPLHDDLFDLELDASYAMNSRANTIEIRFRDNNGQGAVSTLPTGTPVPPNADRWNGFIDSYGLRLGGQWNAVQDRFALRAGGWMETRSQEPEFLTMFPVGAARWGFGGGVVLRQDFLDVSVGYQRHMSSGLDNGGNGGTLANVGTRGGGSFNVNDDPAGVSAQDRTQFRSERFINGGQVTQSAHVFSLGGTVRF